ncbi:GIY-YIG nuclease family protein [Oricola sp.]|uniref:GIY-YIG nuclease family protein n=1 Tax=Oricola sp. TaxID=1979950 RepID=UPI0025F35C20|nr:GIY-YIG nuclease family protein [Oricola sp.]MCI5075743.1 GIY-YIG nuclease family protein [Oricola sp.]
MEIGDFQPESWIRNFGVKHGHPGWLYVFRNGNRIKVGKTKNIQERRKAARTWIPDIEIVGIKPFWHASYLERAIHIALSDFWVAGEWFDFKGDEFEKDFIETFCDFYDDDINRNSVDFIYWMNSTGMSEMTLEQSQMAMTLPKWREHLGHRNQNQIS